VPNAAVHVQTIDVVGQFEVVVAAGVLRSVARTAVRVPHRWAAEGVTVEAPFTACRPGNPTNSSRSSSPVRFPGSVVRGMPPRKECNVHRHVADDSLFFGSTPLNRPTISSAERLGTR
jgi:hypothetical protein